MLKVSILTLIIGVVAVLYYNSLHQIVPGPIVSTVNGPVQGIVSTSRDGNTFYEYYGLPYAKPPIGDLRFEPPQPLDSHWTAVRDASNVGSSCLQWNLLTQTQEGHEDCLFLNVFTPEVNPAGKLHKTMVWIHGGVFVGGSSSMYRGDYWVDEDVILVTINYRLGALGFMNTGDGLVRGNMGLKDQVMALRWVKENIANFGGDPNDVLIFGESAGGASVDFHLHSPMSKGLFSKAISQSGVAASSWTFRDDPVPQTVRYAKNVNCLLDSSAEMVACLKSLSPAQLLQGHQETMEILKETETLFGPTIEPIRDENAFITEHPLETLRKGQTLSVPVLIGYNAGEGLLSSASIARDLEIMKEFDTDFSKLMADFLMFPTNINKKTRDTVMDKARNYYFGKGQSIGTFDQFENFTKIASDFRWAEGIYKTAKTLQKQNTPVYLYYYAYKGQFTLTNILLALKGKFPMAIEFLLYQAEQFFRHRILRQTLTHYGACHGDEMALQFKLIGMNDIGRSHQDYAMSKKLVNLWASFAKGTHPGQLDGVEWVPIQDDRSTLQYLRIDENPGMIPQPHQERIDFWRKIFPSIGY